MFQYSIRQLYLHKLDDDPKDYEDASAYKENSCTEIQTLCFAIADGATNSIFAGKWANMLVNRYVEHPFIDEQDFRENVDLLSKDWQSSTNARTLPWYAEVKARGGAFSTFLGLEIIADASQSEDSGNWKAIAIGDSCFFQVRNNSLIQSFPLKKSEDFDSFPNLVSSNLIRNNSCWANMQMVQGECQSGDIIFLTTDALAEWFLHECELGRNPWEELKTFIDDEDYTGHFESWVNDKRVTLLLKNDDVTCLIIKI